MREGYTGNLSPKDIVRYQKESYTPTLSTLEERNEEAPWEETYKICILGQDESLEPGEDLISPTKSPSQIPTNLEEVYKDEV